LDECKLCVLKKGEEMIAVKRMSGVWLWICLPLIIQQCWGAQLRPSKQLEAFNAGVEKTRKQDSLIDGLQVMTKNIALALVKDADEFRKGLQQGLDNALRLLPQLPQEIQGECFNNIENLMVAAQGKEKIFGRDVLGAIVNPRRETLSRLKVDYQALERERDVARQQLEQTRLAQEQEHQQAEQARGVYQQQLMALQQQCNQAQQERQRADEQLAMVRQELVAHQQVHQQMLTALQRQLDEERQQLTIAQQEHQQALAALQEQKKREIEEADEKSRQLADQEIVRLKKENEDNRLALEQRMRDQARMAERDEEVERQKAKLEQMLEIKDDEIKELKRKEALYHLNRVITEAPFTHDFLSIATPNNVIDALEKWIGKGVVEQPQDVPLSLKDLVEIAGKLESIESLRTGELMDFLKMIVHKIQMAKSAMNGPVDSLARDMQNKEANPGKKFTRTDIEKARKKYRKAWWKAHDQEILLENLLRDIDALEKRVRARH
jgi:hypothetical protein